MAQIFVFGRVMNDLVPKESQSKQSYVCFDLMERTKNWTQFYQVWAWDADVTRLMQFKVKKGSMIWLAGSQRLVDVRMKDGKLEKKLKVSLNDFGFLPKQPAAANRQENDPDITAEPAPPPSPAALLPWLWPAGRWWRRAGSLRIPSAAVWRRCRRVSWGMCLCWTCAMRRTATLWWTSTASWMRRDASSSFRALVRAAALPSRSSRSWCACAPAALRR